MPEVDFDKYKKRGSMHWQEMTSRSIRKFNSYQQARYDWIIKELGNIKGKRVLDIGCGDGALSYLLAKEGAVVVGIDNEALGIQFAQENVKSESDSSKLDCEFVQASAYELPMKDESFDAVVSSELIEHLDKPGQMLAEAKRVLKPGGKAVITTPHRLTETPGDIYHVHEFFPIELQDLSKKYFSEVEVKLTHHVFWYGLFTYAFRRFKNRQFGMWFVNALTLWFKKNPFLIEYPKPTKRDIFTQLIVISKK